MTTISILAAYQQIKRIIPTCKHYLYQQTICLKKRCTDRSGGDWLQTVFRDQADMSHISDFVPDISTLMCTAAQTDTDYCHSHTQRDKTQSCVIPVRPKSVSLQTLLGPRYINGDQCIFGSPFQRFAGRHTVRGGATVNTPVGTDVIQQRVGLDSVDRLCH